MNNLLTHIEYDDRENAPALLSALTNNSSIQLEKTHLPLGDYRFNDWVIERKTLSDLARSICDGRLFSQVSRLADSPYNATLLIEGCSKELINYDISREAIIGALCSISVIFQIPTLRSLSQQESAKIIYYCANQLQRRALGGIVGKRKPKRNKNRQIFILQSLPQVGPVLAERLLQHFKSVEQVINASAVELCVIDGVGKAKADAIRNIVSLIS